MKLGLIAGNGRFPFLVLEAARAQGHQVTVIATKEEAFKDLDDAAKKCGAAIHWISIGELGACIRLLTEAGATHAVMAGQVKHTKIFAGGIRPDATFLGVLARLTLEPIGLSGDPEQGLVDGVRPALCRGCAAGEGEHQHEKRERRPHRSSIGRNTDAVYQV